MSLTHRNSAPAAAAPSAAPAGKRRLAWPDVAKGISILGVVMLHVSLQVPESESTWLYHLNTWIDPLRMPLFFIVSGFFSAKVLNFSLWELFSRRLWFFLVPYLVWVPVELLTGRELYHHVFGDERFSAWDLFYNLLMGHNMGWFLHALIVFNLFLWAVRKLPRWLGMALTLLPVVVVHWHDQFYFVGKALMYLPVFVAGVYAREHIKRWAGALDDALAQRRVTGAAVAVTVISAALYAVGYWTRQTWNALDEEVVMGWPLLGTDEISNGEILLFVRLIEQSCMLPAAILGAVLISHIPYVSRGFQFVGRHTLPIYLGHPIALTLGYGFFMAFNELTVSHNGEWPFENTWFWIVVCIGYAGLGSLFLWFVSRIPVLRWTMTPPAIAGRARPAREPMVNQTDPAVRGAQGTG